MIIIKLIKCREHEDKKCATSNIESPAEVSKNDLAALTPNEDSVSNRSIKLTSPTSDSTLNSVESLEVDGIVYITSKSSHLTSKFSHNFIC